jgi:hypothetical protein
LLVYGIFPEANCILEPQTAMNSKNLVPGRVTSILSLVAICILHLNLIRVTWIAV